MSDRALQQILNDERRKNPYLFMAQDDSEDEADHHNARQPQHCARRSQPQSIACELLVAGHGQRQTAESETTTKSQQSTTSISLIANTTDTVPQEQNRQRDVVKGKNVSVAKVELENQSAVHTGVSLSSKCSAPLVCASPIAGIVGSGTDELCAIVEQHRLALQARQQLRASKRLREDRLLDRLQSEEALKEEKRQTELRELARSMQCAQTSSASSLSSNGNDRRGLVSTSQSPQSNNNGELKTSDESSPSGVGVRVQCRGCHNSRDLSMFYEDSQVYKSCKVCRRHSAKYHAENREMILIKRKRAYEYSNQLKHHCPCGSIITMLSRRSHERSRRHRVWMVDHPGVQPTALLPETAEGTLSTMENTAIRL
jgi:ribosomal protein S27E